MVEEEVDMVDNMDKVVDKVVDMVDMVDKVLEE